jgi:hypothetical protein
MMLSSLENAQRAFSGGGAPGSHKTGVFFAKHFSCRTTQRIDIYRIVFHCAEESVKNPDIARKAMAENGPRSAADGATMSPTEMGRSCHQRELESCRSVDFLAYVR